ncbi:MAG TPA: hypothetical protein VIF60_07285 [Burkholderiaceae bacterium]|jgi:hypothetical protein
MTAFTLPDPADIRDTIKDCLAVLYDDPQAGNDHIEDVIERCVASIGMLFKAAEMAGRAGPKEQAVFAYFVAALHAQAIQNNKEVCTSPHRRISTEKCRLPCG